MDSLRIGMRGVLVAVLAVAGSSVACTEPVVEQKAHTTAKLGAPRPLVKAKASPATQEKEGIAEWRIFRGRNDVVLSGYGANGKPVKGITIGFRRGADEGPVMRARLLDGSMFALRHEYAARRTVTNGEVEQSTATFLYAALADMRALNRAVAQTSTSSRSIRIQTFDPGAFGCGSDMMAILASALECLKSSGGSSAAISQCIAAAESAAGVGGACGGAPDVPFDPTAGGIDVYGDPWGPGGMGDPWGDPYGPGPYGDPYGPGGMGDPYGDPYGPYGDPYGGMGDPYGDPYGMGDPYGDPYGGMGDPYGDPWGDPYGDPWGGGGMGGWGDDWGAGDWGDVGWDDGWLIGLGGDWGDDPFGDGWGCPSCAGPGAGDICGDPFSGDVGYDGDFGAGVFDGYGEGF